MTVVRSWLRLNWAPLLVAFLAAASAVGAAWMWRAR